MSKKILSVLLALIMLLSLAAPIIPVSAASTVSATASETPTSDLRIGVLSDIHISYDYVDEVYGNVTGHFNGVQPSRFEKALRFFKAKGVEAVVVNGDLQESSGTTDASLDAQKDWLQTVVDIWFEVFPEAPGEEGYVEPIFIYGNHDSALVSQKYWPEEWGTYADAFTKTVNGYTFVCAHNAMESQAANLLEKVAANNADKPIFYLQHCPINNTVPGSTSGYGVGYGQTGRNNIGNYPNVVAFASHTHAPLTDEKSIWQGDSGNEGQFTVINTATINYTGLNNDNMSVNSYAGNAQQTEHGMIMDITGSNVSVDRFSFNDMTIDTETNTISGEVVKIGETWAWDACDVNDRPYAWDTRYATANAPVFADGAALSVGTVTDTSVSVTIPAASLTAPSGYSDMIESYVVEACDPTSGEVEATGRVATSYHVDDKADVYEASYNVTISGLKAGTKYVLKAYAQEFFKKRSAPLTAEITTTGTLASYRRGDVNKDGDINAADMTALEAILANPSTYNYDGDIDLNGINETRDITELQAILDGKKITYPETGDLMDLVTKVTLTGVSTSTKYQPVDYGTIIQNQVVRGDSKQAVKTWTTNYAYYPVTTMYFDEPVDLSSYTHLSFDTLFENEYSVSESYRKRWLSLSFISGDQEQVAALGSMNFDPNGEGWTTKTVSLATLKNIDLSAVTGIRFSHNFDYYEGRYDGVTEHGIYWDNFYGLVIEGADSDLLNGATITGGEIIYGAGFTNNTNQAIQSTGGTMDFTFESEKVLTDYAGIKVDMRTPVATTVQVQALDADGNVIGSAVSVKTTTIYQTVNVSVPAMGLTEGTVVSGLRFTYTCESLLLDNMQLQGAKDYDLIGTATGFTPVGGDSCSAFITTEGGNGSNNALYASAQPGTSVWSGGGELIYDTPLDLSETPFLRFDMKVQNAHWAFGVVLYNSNGEEIWKTTHYNATSSGGQYATYEFDLRTYRTYDDGYTYHDVTAEQLKDVAKIRLTCDLASSPNWMTSDDTALREVWFDNLVACNPLEDFFGAETSLTKPSAVQDGFVCEIMPSTADGHTNVLHWYSDSSVNAGTTSAWPGETIVSFTKDVNLMNHSGYEGSYDYLEFDIKTVGMYIAMYLTVKDENGANLGSTGEYRISYEQEWSTYRVDAAALGMSQEDFNKIAQVQIGWNWQHQNATGTTVQYMADVYIDNMGLRSIDAESEDLLDQISLIRNQDWWTGANGKFTGGGWKFQSDVTAESDKAFMFYRNNGSEGISYGGGKTLYMYFDEPITLDAKWSLEIDAIKQNYNANAGKMQIIGSDGNKYTVFEFTHTTAGVYTYSTLVSAIAGFDPTTTTVTGLYFTYPMNPDSSMDKTALGYMALDNLNIAIPEPMDEDDFLYTATCSVGQNQTAVTNNSLSAWKLSPTVDNWSYPQFVLANAVDISNHTLTFDMMYTGMSTFRMHLANINGDWGGNSGAAQYYYEPDTWVTVSYDLSGNSAGITSMERFSLGVECYLAEGAESLAIYIDNVKLIDNDEEPEATEPEVTEPEVTEPSQEETIENDWIHMVKDSGMSENVAYELVEDNTYGDSTYALKIETGSGYRLTFNPQSAVLNGTLPEVVNMTKGGLIGGYFYFGDQTPSVKIRLTDKNWNGGASLELNMIDAGNGWYYCYKDVSEFYFYEGATNPTKEEIIRISVILPSDYTVYLDQFMYPTYIPADLADYRIVYDADDSKAVAKDVAVRLQNDMEWIVDVVPDTLTAVENEIVLGDAARANATVASYLTGGDNELGEFDYAVVVDNGKIYLAANTNAGLYQALDKLVELASAGTIADGTYLKDAYDTTDNAALAEGADVRVMSYNVLYSTEYLVEDRIGNFLNILGYYKPDVIGTQETSAGSNAGWHEYIQDALVADGIYQKACYASDSISGLMTTFLYNPDTVKLIDEYVIDLEEASQIRVLAVAVFERLADGQQFVVTNTHPAPHGSTNYSANLTAMLTAAQAELEKYADLPVIMVGDFNTDESDAEYQTIMSTLGVVDSKYSADTMVREYNTWSGFGVEPIEGSDYCIDHIFVNNNVDAKLYNIVIDHDVEHTSDHIPLYADLQLSVDAEPEVPADPNPEDPGDLLGATNAVSYNKDHWDNYTENATGLTAVVDTENTYGDVSTRSWAYKATTDANKAEAVAQMAMKYAYDMTGKMLVFDVKFDSTDTTQTLALNTRLHEAGSWADVTTNISKTLKAGYWQTVALDFSGNIVSGKDLTAVQFITFTMNFASNTGTERALYIDNVRLVDVETIEDDLIHCKVDSGSTGNKYWISDEYTYGDSSFSMRLENATSGDNDIYYNSQAQYGNDNLPSFKNKIVAAYFYFGDQTPYATLQLVDKSWSGVIASGFSFEDMGDGWYYGQVNTARITTHSATTDLSQCIRFSINIASGAVVYVDDLKVLPGESGADDWTNIWMDSGATKGAWGPNTEYTYGENSLVSMRFEPTGGSYISFHTQNEVSRNGGAWDAYPDFSAGLFSAYIYFGDQTPAVKLQLTDTNWKNSTNTAMNLEDVGDGWYHATLDLATLVTPDGFDISTIIRVYLTFTAGQKVYIDEMSILPLPNCMEDHLGTSPGVRRPTSGIEDGYVIEILDSYEGYSNVFHVAADPNNGGGTTTNWPDQPSYYVGESGASYSADEYDYYEFTFKGTNHYSDISVTFLDESNTTLGSVSGFRMSHKDSGWMTFRIDLASAGLTAEEVKLVRRVSFGFNWQYQNSTGTALLAADLYWRDCGFGCNDETSTDLLDQINLIKNSDYWYGGYSAWTDAGWYFDENGAFTFYRDANNPQLGYADRTTFVYFKPVTVKNGERLSLDIVNTNFPVNSKVELVGSDDKLYTFGSVNQTGSYNLTVCVNDLATSDGVAFDPDTVTIKGIKFTNRFYSTSVDLTTAGTLAYTALTVLEALPNAADDMFSTFKSIIAPTAVQENFVAEYVAEMDDGRTDVIRIAATTDNGLPTSNWPGNTKVYIGSVPSYVDTTEFDYFEFTVKNTGIKYALYITLYDANGTSLGATSEFRMSNGCGWATHRLDLTTMGLTAEEIYLVDRVEISVSWEYNNANGTTKQAGELLFDNFRFGSVEDDSTDLLDHVVKTSLLGSGATTKYPGSDWYWNEDGAFVITRDSTSTGWVTMRLYFDEALTVESDWTVSCDFDITNFHHGGSIALIGSDGKVYSSVGPNKGGINTVSKAISAFASSGTAFDPATVQIVGIHISYSLGTSANVTDTTVGGYMSLDNLLFIDPSAE